MITILNLIITNSVNDDVSRKWFITTSDEEKKKLKDDKEKERDDWNYKTPGAVSYRYYDWEEYSEDRFDKLTLSDLKGLPIMMLIKIINHVSSKHKLI